MGSATGGEINSVLVVDDERDIRTVAEMSLSTIAGWKTRLAVDGDDALGIARQEHFDAVLLDMMMPGRDGLSTLRALRELPGWENIPVIMVTAKAQRHEIRAYIEAGAAGVITKPFDPMTLPQRVRDLARRSIEPPPTSRPDLNTRLAALRKTYVAKLPGKLQEIEQTLEIWISTPSTESYHATRTPAHKLHGTAGSYGLAEVSSAAGELEALIMDVGESGKPEPEALREAVSGLRATIESVQSTRAS